MENETTSPGPHASSVLPRDLGPHKSRVPSPMAPALGAHASSVLPPDLGPHASRVPSPMAPTLGGQASSLLLRALGPHASRVPFPMAPAPGPNASSVPFPKGRETGNKNLGPHASSVLPPATKKSARMDKVCKPASPSSSSLRDATHNRSVRTTVTLLQNSGQSGDARPFSAWSLLHAPTFQGHDSTADNRLHKSRRNPVGFYPRASAVLALHNSANVPLSDPASAPLKNPSISAVTAEVPRPRMVVQFADEMASHFMPSGCGPIEKYGKISTSSINSTISAMDTYLEKSGKNSTNNMNSMPTHVAIGGVAPASPAQSERCHSGDPNGTRPQFRTEKSVNNSANSAIAAKPANKGNGALTTVQPVDFQTWQHATEKSVNISGNSGGIQTKNGNEMGQRKWGANSCPKAAT